MGTFAGHAVPGSFFIIMSLWWTISINFRYSRARRSTSRFRSTLTFPCAGTVPLESFAKLFLCLVGVAGETATGFDDVGIFGMNNAQHITMFSFFGLQALLEVLMFYDAPLPPYLDYAGTILAFLMQGLLFAYHLHGRTQLDVLVHTLLIYVIFSCAIAVALEATWRGNVLYPLVRSYCVLLQGTWFYQVGFILYPPLEGMTRWDPHNHKQMMMVVMVFTWHCAVDFLIVLILSVAVYTHQRKVHGAGTKLSMHHLLPQKKQQQNHTAELLDDTDTESEGV